MQSDVALLHSATNKLFSPFLIIEGWVRKGACLTQTCVVLQFYVTYDLYIAAFAGAGITLLALVSDCSVHGLKSILKKASRNKVQFKLLHSLCI